MKDQGMQTEKESRKKKKERKIEMKMKGRMKQILLEKGDNTILFTKKERKGKERGEGRRKEG